jgi:hypothetical protein
MTVGAWNLPDLCTPRVHEVLGKRRARFPQLPHASTCLDPYAPSVNQVAGQICYGGRRPVNP